MAEVTDSHDISIGSTDTAASGKCGFKFTTNYALRVIKITKTSSTYTSKGYILDSDKNVLYTANFVGNEATFTNANLTAATTYYMASDDGGPVYQRNLTYSDQSYPKNRTNINYTGALDSGNDSLKGFSLLSITTELIELEISNWEDLANIANNLTDDYVLTCDLDKNSAGYDIYASSSANGGAGWLPLRRFTGTFDGQNHTISDLYINHHYLDSSSDVGLFGSTEGATIENIGIVDCDITGLSYTGGLVGDLYVSSISNSYSTGSVSGGWETGGLVGYQYSSSISSSYSTGSVHGSNDDVGGLVGYQSSNSTITNSYATGSVNGLDNVGGLVGYQYSSSNTDCFWDTQTSGQTTSAGQETGKTTAQMKDIDTFTNWDFTNIWDIDPSINEGYPYLRAFIVVPGFLDITGVTAPESTHAGEEVDFTIHTENTGTDDNFLVELTGDVVGSQEFFLGSGLTKDLPYSFTMPNHNVSITANTYHFE